MLPALYQPARLLGEVTFADNLAGGRLILGLGSGYQAYELARFGVTLEEARAVPAPDGGSFTCLTASAR